MYSIEAVEFIEAIKLLYAIRREFREVAQDEALEGNLKPMNDKLEKLFKHLILLQTTTTAKTVRDLMQKLDTGSVKVSDLMELIKETDRNLKRELEDRYLYSIDAKYAKFIETTEPPFGEIDLTRLGGVAGEVSEAAKCLALRRYKALVFHLMLAMEEAVRILAAVGGATTHDKNGKWLTWLVIAANIDDQVIKGMPEGDTKVAWHNANAMLKSVGHAWRNPTDHPGASYSEEVATDIYDAVKRFMRALVPLI